MEQAFSALIMVHAWHALALNSSKQKTGSVTYISNCKNKVLTDFLI